MQTRRNWTVMLVALPLTAVAFAALLLGALTLIGTGPSPVSASPAAVDSRAYSFSTAVPVFYDQPIVAPPCSVIATQENALVRSAPAEVYAPFGVLETGGSVQALGRTTTQPVWYAVGYSERRGWVAASAGALMGDCASLPMVANPLVPDAPPDLPAFLVEVDRDGLGAFRESISAPGGDGEDLVWVRVINLYSQPPNNFRMFTMTLTCSDGADRVTDNGLRWGLAGGSQLACGGSLTFPFAYGASDRPLIVNFTPGSPQSYVEYTITVTPPGSEIVPVADAPIPPQEFVVG